MINKITTQCAIRTFANITITVCIISLFSMGCVGPSMAKPAAKKGADGVVYEVTAKEALELAHWAVAQVLPDQKTLPLKKPRLGLLIHEVDRPSNYKYARFRETDYIYELDLIESMGNTPQGVSVTGFTYTIKGNGDLKAGPEKVTQIEQRLNEAFDQTGRAVAVNSAQAVPPGPPKISSAKPPALIPPATPPASPSPSTALPKKPEGDEPPATVVPMVTDKEPPAEKDAEDAFVKLKKLKELLDQGIITEEEFQMKKKELLERI